MEVRQCKECGKLFLYIGRPACPDCMEELNRKFMKVRDYLYKHPDSNIAAIAKETEVQEKYIFEFLKEERLSLHSPNGTLACEQCGAAIQTGRFCEKCRDELGKLLRMPEKTSAPPPQPKRMDGRMHVTRYDKR